MDFGMMATAGVGLVVGAFVGVVIAGLCGASKVHDAENEASRWKRLWERDNNRIAAFREKADKIFVAKRAAKGRVAGRETVRARINGLLCLEGRQHDCL